MQCKCTPFAHTIGINNALHVFIRSPSYVALIIPPKAPSQQTCLSSVFYFGRQARQLWIHSTLSFSLSPEPQNRPFQSPDKPHALHAAGGKQPAWQSLHNDPIRIENSREKTHPEPTAHSVAMVCRSTKPSAPYSPISVAFASHGSGTHRR